MVHMHIFLIFGGRTLNKRGPFTGREANRMFLTDDEALEAMLGILHSRPRLEFQYAWIGVLSKFGT